MHYRIAAAAHAGIPNIDSFYWFSQLLTVILALLMCVKGNLKWNDKNVMPFEWRGVDRVEVNTHSIESVWRVFMVEF